VVDLNQRCTNLPKIYKPKKSKVPEGSYKKEFHIEDKKLDATVQNLLATVT